VFLAGRLFWLADGSGRPEKDLPAGSLRWPPTTPPLRRTSGPHPAGTDLSAVVGLLVEALRDRVWRCAVPPPRPSQIGRRPNRP